VKYAWEAWLAWSDVLSTDKLSTRFDLAYLNRVIVTSFAHPPIADVPARRRADVPSHRVADPSSRDAPIRRLDDWRPTDEIYSESLAAMERCAVDG